MSAKYRVLGVMSGTSLDGLDLALCTFIKTDGKWSFNIDVCDSIAYSKQWQDSLAHSQTLNAYDFVKLHREYGMYIGTQIQEFLSPEMHVDFIASHGHTVFHEPENNVTFQIGCGAQIKAVTGYKTISDFRTLDIALGGQGAPLVPIGDELLFAEYDGCVNFGGFANISFANNKKRLAFDICPINIITNQIVRDKYGLDYDDKGEIGKKGIVNHDLLVELNAIPFYTAQPPKSLAREWIENVVNPILKSYNHLEYQDILATLYQHYAQQIVAVIESNNLKTVLFTGGGTFNTYLMELISGMTTAKITIPSKEIIDFKEALVFAFLGVLQQEGEMNCLQSVTGAQKDNCGGSVFV